jgi:hypothetical protein
VVVPRAQKPQKGITGLWKWETSITLSEETHASSTHESDGGKDEDNLPPKGKRTASEDAEAGARPTGPKRLKETLAGAVDQPQPSEKNMLSDESKDDPLALGRKKPAPRRYTAVLCIYLHIKFFWHD